MIRIDIWEQCWPSGVRHPRKRALPAKELGARYQYIEVDRERRLVRSFTDEDIESIEEVVPRVAIRQ